MSQNWVFLWCYIRIISDTVIMQPKLGYRKADLIFTDTRIFFACFLEVLDIMKGGNTSLLVGVYSQGVEQSTSNPHVFVEVGESKPSTYLTFFCSFLGINVLTRVRALIAGFVLLSSAHAHDSSIGYIRGSSYKKNNSCDSEM